MGASVSHSRWIPLALFLSFKPFSAASKDWSTSIVFAVRGDEVSGAFPLSLSGGAVVSSSISTDVIFSEGSFENKAADCWGSSINCFLEGRYCWSLFGEEERVL